MKIITFHRFAVLAAAVSILAGCSHGGAPESSGQKIAEVPDDKKDPIKIKITIYNGMGEDLFRDAYTDPVKKKYPYITVEQVKPQKGVSLEDMIAAGNFPDIYEESIANLTQTQLGEDLTPYLKKYNISLSSFEERAMDAINKRFIVGGKLYALPITTNLVTLLYNKEIFDKVGIPYPKDGMTWPQAIDLAKKLTVLDNGVQYRGLDIQLGSIMNLNQLSLPVIDSKTMKAAVNNDGWRKWFETMLPVYQINGNQIDSPNAGAAGFLDKRTIAMYVTTTLFSSLPNAEKNGLKWDTVTIPYFSDQAPSNIQPTLSGGLALSTKSKQKEEAFKVIAFLASEEGQLAGTKVGRMGVHKNPEVNTHFGENIEVLKGKNMAAFYKYKFAPVALSTTELDATAYTILQAKFKDVAMNTKDTNTALREAEEEINKMIESKK